VLLVPEEAEDGLALGRWGGREAVGLNEREAEAGFEVEPEDGEGAVEEVGVDG
jgi:hypothetical protein